MGNNKIITIPKEICQLTSLEELYFDYNQITNVPKEICQLTALKILTLSCNQIETIPKEVYQLHSLKKLYIYRNLFPIKLSLDNNLQEIVTYFTKLEQIVRSIQKIKIALCIYYKWIEQYDNNLSIEI